MSSIRWANNTRMIRKKPCPFGESKEIRRVRRMQSLDTENSYDIDVLRGHKKEPWRTLLRVAGIGIERCITGERWALCPPGFFSWHEFWFETNTFRPCLRRRGKDSSWTDATLLSDRWQVIVKTVTDTKCGCGIIGGRRGLSLILRYDIRRRRISYLTCKRWKCLHLEDFTVP